MTALVLRDVEVGGRAVDVRVSRGVVDRVGGSLRPEAGDEVIDGRGGALLPGLWDHHTHLLAAGAARRSVHVGPDVVDDLGRLGAVLATAPTSSSGWVRAVGYHESAAGELDRTVLDRIDVGRPVRVQHRSGALWILDSRGVELAGLDGVEDARVERGADGRATGRVFGGDELLRARLPPEPPDLRGVGRALAAVGVVGVLDATPCTDVGGWELIASACTAGDLPQRVWVTNNGG